MSFNDLMLKEKLSGRNTQRYLIKEIFRFLIKNGYKVNIEYRLENNGIADIFAKKGTDTLIVECLTKPSLNYVKDKIKKYKDQSKRFAIAYPSNFVPNFPIEDFVDETFKVKIPEGILSENVFGEKDLKVTLETWKAIMTIKIEEGYSSVDEVIKDLLKSQKLNKGAKK